jgi:hypothetical protein
MTSADVRGGRRPRPRPLARAAAILAAVAGLFAMHRLLMTMPGSGLRRLTLRRHDRAGGGMTGQVAASEAGERHVFGPPATAGRVITSVTREAERRLGIPRHVTEQTIRVALDLDGDMGDTLDGFLARVITPAADSQSR